MLPASFLSLAPGFLPFSVPSLVFDLARLCFVSFLGLPVREEMVQGLADTPFETKV